MDEDEFIRELELLRHRNEGRIDLDSNLDQFSQGALNAHQFSYNYDLREVRITDVQNLDSVLGYSETDITMEFYMSLIHPQDINQVLRITAVVLKLALDLNLGRSAEYSISYRMRQKNGKYVRVLRHTSPLKIDSQGKMVASTSTVTDISFLNSANDVRWYIPWEKRYKKEVREALSSIQKIQFSTREVQIIELLAEGLTSSEIALRLNLSKHTIDTHRRRMLRRTNVLTTIELLRMFYLNP